MLKLVVPRDFTDFRDFKDFRLDFRDFRSDFRTFVHGISEVIGPSYLCSSSSVEVKKYPPIERSTDFKLKIIVYKV